MTRVERRSWREDTGTTLLEMVVSMAILMIFMGIFTTATLMMTRTTTKVQEIADSTQQTSQAFLAMERSLRYATGISTPQVTGGVWNVEFGSRIVTNGVGSDTCTQLRIASGQLQQRRWTVSGTAATGVSGWRPVASNVVNGTAAAGAKDSANRTLDPFTVPGSLNASTAFQRLTVTIVTSGRSSGSGTTTRSSTTYTALNSSADSTSEVCQQGGTTP